MRKAFSFYRSHYEQMKLLNKTQLADLTIAICEVQFLEVNIDDIKFDDALTQIVWVGIKHAVEASVLGYINAKGDISAPLAGGSKDISNTPEQEEGEEEEKEEVKEAVKPFTFALNQQTQVTSLSKEYLSQLEAYIKESKYSLSYEDFTNGLEAKGNKYKNFKSAYISWAKNNDRWNKDTKPKKDREWAM